ncbi:hypothetical protein VTI74DRAFT_578 [Chaetomium olivicolor]
MQPSSHTKEPKLQAGRGMAGLAYHTCPFGPCARHLCTVRSMSLARRSAAETPAPLPRGNMAFSTNHPASYRPLHHSARLSSDQLRKKRCICPRGKSSPIQVPNWASPSRPCPRVPSFPRLRFPPRWINRATSSLNSRYNGYAHLCKRRQLERPRPWNL